MTNTFIPLSELYEGSPTDFSWVSSSGDLILTPTSEVSPTGWGSPFVNAQGNAINGRLGTPGGKNPEVTLSLEDKTRIDRKRIVQAGHSFWSNGEDILTWGGSTRGQVLSLWNNTNGERIYVPFSLSNAVYRKGRVLDLAPSSVHGAFIKEVDSKRFLLVICYEESSNSDILYKKQISPKIHEQGEGWELVNKQSNHLLNFIAEPLNSSIPQLSATPSLQWSIASDGNFGLLTRPIRRNTSGTVSSIHTAFALYSFSLSSNLETAVFTFRSYQDSEITRTVKQVNTVQTREASEIVPGPPPDFLSCQGIEPAAPAVVSSRVDIERTANEQSTLAVGLYNNKEFFLKSKSISTASENYTISSNNNEQGLWVKLDNDKCKIRIDYDVRNQFGEGAYSLTTNTVFTIEDEAGVKLWEWDNQELSTGSSSAEFFLTFNQGELPVYEPVFSSATTEVTATNKATNNGDYIDYIDFEKGLIVITSVASTVTQLTGSLRERFIFTVHVWFNYKKVYEEVISVVDTQSNVTPFFSIPTTSFGRARIYGPLDENNQPVNDELTFTQELSFNRFFTFNLEFINNQQQPKEFHAVATKRDFFVSLANQVTTNTVNASSINLDEITGIPGLKKLYKDLRII